MAAETDAVIKIRADGSDQAAAAIGSVSKSMNAIGASSDELKSKFQERFQHLGLMLFAGDALQASGLGAETRTVITSLNLALTEGAAAAGVASGGITLMVTALVAMVGVAEKIIDHQKSEADSLEKLRAEYDKQVSSIQQNIDAATAYEQTGAKLPPTLQAWIDSETKLKDSLVASNEQIAVQQIAAINQLIAKQEEKIDATKDEIKTITDWRTANAAAMQIDKQYADNVGMGTGVLKAYTGQLQTQENELEALSEKLKKAEADTSAMHSGFAGATDQLKQLTDVEKAYDDQVQKTMDEENKEFEQFGRIHEEKLAKHIEMLKKLADADTQYFSDSDQKMMASLIKQQTANDNHAAHLTQTSQAVAHDIASAFSNAFAKMIVEGGNFHDVMEQMFTNLMEQVISDIIRMEVEWTVFMAMSGGGGGMMGAFGMAEGGSYVVNQPTMFLAGEAGQPEIATFTPLSKLGGGMSSVDQMGGGGGGGVNIGTIQTNVYGVTDPDDIADQVGMKIVERIRGQGDISFARSA